MNIRDLLCVEMFLNLLEFIDCLYLFPWVRSYEISLFIWACQVVQVLLRQSYCWDFMGAASGSCIASRYYLEAGNFIIWFLFCTLFQKFSCTLDEWTLMVTCSTFIFAVVSLWSGLWVLNKRSFLDVEWELHLSIGLKTNISNTVGDHIGLGKWKQKIFL